MNISAK